MAETEIERLTRELAESRAGWATMRTLHDSLSAADADIEAALTGAGESSAPLPGGTMTRSFAQRIRDLAARLGAPSPPEKQPSASDKRNG